jgi:hypothetical protein
VVPNGPQPLSPPLVDLQHYQYTVFVSDLKVTLHTFRPRFGTMDLLLHFMLVLFITANNLTPIFHLLRSYTTKLNKMVNICVSQLGLRENDQRHKYFTVYS